MFITQNKYERLNKKVKELQEENDRLINIRLEEKHAKTKEFSALDDKITFLSKEKKRLVEEIEDLKAEKRREEENLKHKVKIVLEKHDFELLKEKQELEATKNTEIAKVKDEYRDKYEVQLDKRGTEMKEMYNTVLEKLTNVAGTITQPGNISVGKE